MLKQLSEPLQKFFGFLGASLTGITAIFTATGFLAERARLTMLGLPSATFDLQQYLETGARFLAFLPLYLGMAFYYTVLDLFSAILYGLAQNPLWWAAVVVVVVAAFFWWRRRTPLPPADRRTLHGRLLLLLKNHPVALLVAFLLIQFLGAYQLTQALEISNLLFEPTVDAADNIPHAQLSIIGTETLRDWIVRGEAARAAQFLGWLFLITLLTAWGLHYMLRLHRESAQAYPSFWHMAAFGASVLLLVTQATLLPINYGILLSSNRFVEVTVVFDESGEAEAGTVRPDEAPLYLIHETSNGYYLYAHERRKVWYVLRGDVQTMLHHRMARILQPRPPHP